MATLPVTRAAAAVDLKRMLEYAAANSWKHFKPKAVAAARSKPELRALFPNESTPANVEATLLQLAPDAKAAVTLAAALHPGGGRQTGAAAHRLRQTTAGGTSEAAAGAWLQRRTWKTRAG